jgi:hypothetical protein
LFGADRFGMVSDLTAINLIPAFARHLAASIQSVPGCSKPIVQWYGDEIISIE